MSSAEIDEFIIDTGKVHPEYTVEQFKADFAAAVQSRPITLADIRLFQKSVIATKAGTTVPYSPAALVSGGSSSSVHPPQSKCHVNSASIFATNCKTQVEETNVIVIDNGTFELRAGFAESDLPPVVLSPFVIQKGTTSFVYGEEAIKYFNALRKTDVPIRLQYPFVGDRISNYDAMESIWGHAFDELKVKQRENYSVLLTKNQRNPLDDCNFQVAELMFEKMNVQALSLQSQQILPIYTTGKNNGVVLNCGQRTTNVTSIFDGRAYKPGTSKIEMGGYDLDECLSRLVLEQPFTLNARQKEHMSAAKEKLCFVALDFDAEMEKTQTYHEFELPDNMKVVLRSERFRCPEVLFRRRERVYRPERINKNDPTVDQQLYQSIMQSPPSNREHLYENIVVCGGTTMFEGFAGRLGKELSILAPTTPINILAPPERKFTVWIGGSILASLSVFNKIKISKAQYEEHGPTVFKDDD